jgi:hypothetical protein
MMRRRRYSDGGKVLPKTKAELEAEAKKAKKPPSPPPTRVLGTGALGKAAETIRHRRREQEEALGLRDGGRVKRRR